MASKSKFFEEYFLYAKAKNILPAKAAICKITFKYDEVVSFNILLEIAIAAITFNIPTDNPRVKFGINNKYVFLFLKTAITSLSP